MYKFGTAIVLFVSFLEVVVSLSDENKAHVQSTFVEAGEKCITEHPITEEDISAFKERRFPDGSGPACFASCVLTKIGILDEQGTVSATAALERAKTVFEDDDELKVVEDFFNTCTKGVISSETKGEGCENAKEISKCFFENAVKFDF